MQNVENVPGKDRSIYHDSLVEIFRDAIVLKSYYFPSLRSKRVPLSVVNRVRIRKPGFFTGKWRVHGSGDIRTWFPLDAQRSKRDRIFLMSLSSQWIQIGFTVEDGAQVEKLLADKGLINRQDF